MVLSSVGFNPRLREGGDLIAYPFAPVQLVSIHASAREATAHLCSCPIPFQCFNPRLREGGDPPTGAPITIQTSFNPRLREGGDKSKIFRNVFRKGFNPRLREGGDLIKYTQ